MTRLTVENLCVRFGDRTIVDRASFAIKTAGVVGIIGPNGCGKTTLLRALLGLLPSSGSIAWQGDASTVRHPLKLARHVAYLAQSPTAIAGQTVGQAILAGRFAKRGAFDFLDSANDAVLVKSIARDLDLETHLHRPIEQLSGGQRQRVFLARCLAQETPTLILDEPATFLDLKHQVGLYQQLRRLARDEDKTILMACHDLNLAATHADRMIVMDAGQIVADGPPALVLSSELLQRIYGVEMRRIDVDGEPHFVVKTAGPSSR